MSKCTDKDCPIHGHSPKAIALRAALQEIKTNEELMNVVRILSANVHETINYQAMKQGDPPYPQAELMMRSILMGNYDSDPIIDGMCRALTLLLAKSHEPTKIFVTECSKIGAPYAVERLMGQEPGDTRTPVQVGNALIFTSQEQLREFLEKNGG